MILANGGDAIYLAHWMRESGLADLLPSVEAVWVGLSGGSLGCARASARRSSAGTHGADDTALGLVDFAIFPHLDHPRSPVEHDGERREVGRDLDIPGYAIDDETAIVWVDGEVEVVSEGNWRRFD